MKMTRKRAYSLYEQAVFRADRKWSEWLREYGFAEASNLHTTYCQNAWDKYLTRV